VTPLGPPDGDLDLLTEHLVRHRIAGEVATPRAASLANYRALADGEPLHQFGLPLSGWTPEQVLAVMAERVGVDPDPDVRTGPDHIDPALTIARLDALADLVADTVRRPGPVLLATGHPAGLLPFYLAAGELLSAAGCQLLTTGEGTPVATAGGRPGEIRFLRGVAMVSAGGGWLHTHAAEPMRLMLDRLAAAQVRPALVLADHGFAGAAGAAGLRTGGFADCNDPALFVAEATGLLDVAVPLDDNVPPGRYEPLLRRLLARARGEAHHQPR
jgi:hypothetical protein